MTLISDIQALRDSDTTPAYVLKVVNDLLGVVREQHHEMKIARTILYILRPSAVSSELDIVLNKHADLAKLVEK